MKRLIVILASLVALAAPAAASAKPLVVFINDDPTDLPQAQLDQVMPRLQNLVDAQLEPAWGAGAQLSDDPTLARQADQIVILQDYPNCLFCLGFHELHLGRPFSYVGIAAAQEDNVPWTIVASHELEEMLVDPWVNRTVRFRGRAWLNEVSDPVEGGSFALWIDGLPFSDFITPDWYGTGSGPYDAAGLLTRAGQIGHDGYAAYWSEPLHRWKAIFG